MSTLKFISCLLALFAILNLTLAHGLQDDDDKINHHQHQKLHKHHHHEYQGRMKRQIAEDLDTVEEDLELDTTDNPLNVLETAESLDIDEEDLDLDTTDDPLNVLDTAEDLDTVEEDLDLDATDDPSNEVVPTSGKFWVVCDNTVTPKHSCYDCRTRLVCKNKGIGKAKPCSSSKPYCNEGSCSRVPSDGCA